MFLSFFLSLKKDSPIFKRKKNLRNQISMNWIYIMEIWLCRCSLKCEKKGGEYNQNCLKVYELSSFVVYSFIKFLSWDYCCEESGWWMPLWMVVVNVGNESSTLWITQLCRLRTLILQVQYFFFPICIKILVFSCNLYCSSGCSSNVFNVFEYIPCSMCVL